MDSNGTSGFSDALGLLGAVPFRADPTSLTTVLEGPHAHPLVGRPPLIPLPEDELWGAVPAPDRQRVLATLRAAADSGRTGVVEHPMAVAGRPLAYFRTAVQRGEEEGRPVLLGVMLDVTDVRAEAVAARELEAWLVTLGETLPFHFWICDRNQRLVLQNPSSRHEDGERLGESAAALAAPDSLARALRGEVVHEQVEAAERSYSRVIAPIRDSEQVTGALAVDIEVTELKRVERELRASLAELAAAQDGLVRARSLAALGDMAATVAHEVRNPLAAMFNVTELLRRDPADEKQGYLLGILFEELNRLDLLVTNILEMVRPLRPLMSPQAVVSLLEEALAEVLRRGGGPGNLEVEWALQDRGLQVAGDGRLLGMALINLLRNAMQAMPDGGRLRLEVAAEDGPDQARRVRIAIRDSGHGIAPEVRGRIFEPFFTTRPSGGGLGLTMVKRVIDEHRGDIEVTSEPGRGSTFLLRLQRSAAAGS